RREQPAGVAADSEAREHDEPRRVDDRAGAVDLPLELPRLPLHRDLELHDRLHLDHRGGFRPELLVESGPRRRGPRERREREQGEEGGRPAEGEGAHGGATWARRAAAGAWGPRGKGAASRAASALAA